MPTTVSDFTALAQADPSGSRDLNGNIKDSGPHIISYRFADGSDTPSSDDRMMTARQQEIMREAFDKFEAVANVRFVEFADADANIHMVTNFGDDAGGVAFLPTSNAYSASLASILAVNYDRLEIALHELGHALGLEHPHDGTRLDPSLDNASNTVMSYNGRSKELGPLDIDALHHLYGAPSASRDAFDITVDDQDRVVIRGTDGNDTIKTASTDTVIDAGAGDDVITMWDGNDVVDGGTGYDTVRMQFVSTWQAFDLANLTLDNPDGSKSLNLTNPIYVNWIGNHVFRNVEAIEFTDGVRVEIGTAEPDPAPTPVPVPDIDPPVTPTPPAEPAPVRVAEATVELGAPAVAARLAISDLDDASGSQASLLVTLLSEGAAVKSYTVKVPDGAYREIAVDHDGGFDAVRIADNEGDVTFVVPDDPVVLSTPLPTPPVSDPPTEPDPDPDTGSGLADGGFAATFVRVYGNVRSLDDIDFDAAPIAELEFDELSFDVSSGAFYEGGPKDNFAMKGEAVLNIETSGTYTFWLTSDDGSKMVIGETVLGNDGLHGRRTKSITLELEAGAHDVEVFYFERGGKAVLDFDWAGPDTGGERIALGVNTSDIDDTAPQAAPPPPADFPDGSLSAAEFFLDGPTDTASIMLAEVSDASGDNARIDLELLLDGELVEYREIRLKEGADRALDITSDIDFDMVRLADAEGDVTFALAAEQPDPILFALGEAGHSYHQHDHGDEHSHGACCGCSDCAGHPDDWFMIG